MSTNSQENKGTGSRKRSASYAGLVTSSRAGDRFHYVWAAAHSLKLLDRQSGLLQVWVERAAGEEVPGSEIVDLAEYYGPKPDTVDRVIVRQLKYSVRRANQPMGLAEIGPVLAKFADIDRHHAEALKVPQGADIRYVFTSNRAVSERVLSAVTAIREARKASQGATAARIVEKTGMSADNAADLLRRISFEGNAADLRTLRAQLGVLTAEMTGELDSTVPPVLIEQISQRASGEINRPLDLATVALAFGADIDDLTPAPSLIPHSESGVSRSIHSELADEILENPRTIISAVGGAGKSTFASSLSELLHGRAVVVLYDCFGNGGYRAPDKPRHRHRDGLVQIASELAARALCAPLIPRSTAGATELLRAFGDRLHEARRRLSETSPGASLVIVIDAADNAVIAASARGELAFVNDLLQMELGEGVHIVFTARPHRVASLHPPLDVVHRQLPEFSLAESGAMLRLRYPEADAREIEEFHRQSSANPRIQQLALSESQTLTGCLDDLAGVNAGAPDPIHQLLSKRLDKVLDVAGTDRHALDFAAQLLGTLRPRVPVDVLSSLTGVDGAAIKSFVSDLGRGFLLDEEAIQFLDEPTETFFRDRYNLTTTNLSKVIEGLTDIAESNSYAAASLPQALWEAGRYEELTQLAISRKSLPNFSEVARQQIAQLRMSFALRAAIRRGDPSAVVQLALLAGEAAASSERRYALLRDEPDLAGETLDDLTLDEVRAARLLPSEWPGSTFGAEAVMLLVKKGREADALNRVRAAQTSIHARLEAPEHGGPIGRLETRHSADIGLAVTLLHGETSGARYLGGWQPSSWVFEQSALVVSRLFSRGEVERVAALGRASRSKALSLAIAAEAQRIGAPLSEAHLSRAWKTIQGPRIDIEHETYSSRNSSDAVYRGVAWITAWAVKRDVATRAEGQRLLDKYLPESPPRGIGDYRGRDNAGLLFTYALRGELSGSPLAIDDLAARLEQHDSTRRRERSLPEEERTQLTTLLPWLLLWARWALGDAADAEMLSIIETYPRSRNNYREPWLLRRIAGPLIIQFARTSSSNLLTPASGALLASATEHSGRNVAMSMVSCLLGDQRFVDDAYACAAAAAASAQTDAQASTEMSADLVLIARSVYSFDQAEAYAYFDKAVEIATRVGDDAYQRWDSVLTLAQHVVLDDNANAFSLATRLARAAEHLEPYLYNGFDSTKLIDALHRMVGTRSLALLSQWRDRRFISLDRMISSVRYQANGISQTHPALSIALSPFSETGRIGPELALLSERNQLTSDGLRAVQDLAWARGDQIDSEDLSEPWISDGHLPPRRPKRTAPRIISSFDDSDSKEQEEFRRQKLIAKLRSSDLLSATGMVEVAAAMEAAPYGTDVEALVAEISLRPRNSWGAIADNFAANESFNSRQRLRFISQMHGLESKSQALVRSLRKMGENFVVQYASEITVGFIYEPALTTLATVLEIDETDVLRRALFSSDAEIAAATADSCYRLAGAIAPLLPVADAEMTLSSSLTAIEQALEIEHRRFDHAVACTVSEPNAAVSAFVSAALADSNAATRWRAMHAARFLIAFGAEESASLIGRFTLDGAPPEFTDARFPQYRMHAAEGFLFAAERAAVERPDRVRPLLGVIASLQREFLDHARIQRLCQRIGQRCGDDGLSERARIPPLPPVIARRYERPKAPKPYGFEAVKSEFSFPFDFEEYAIAPLSESFVVDHEQVLRAMSNLILDEWNYRGSSWIDNDPRRMAGTYKAEETHFYKSDHPATDDFRYYLSYHALLTVAGRLLRSHPTYVDPEDQTLAFEEWYRDFELTRPDGRWLADGRRPVPADLVRRDHTHGGNWQWRVTSGQFIDELFSEPSWVTIKSAASQTLRGGWDDTRVTSSLVGRAAAPALLRALQTAPSFSDHRLPLNEDEDFTVSDYPFELRGWVDAPDSVLGFDKRDDFASDMSYPTPKLSGWIQDLLVGDDGIAAPLDSAHREASHVRVEAWSEKDSSREPVGPDGVRLQVSNVLLDKILKLTGLTLIVEVRLHRSDESNRENYEHHELGGYLDDYVRYFSYEPENGWRDSSGRAVTRQENLRESRPA